MAKIDKTYFNLLNHILENGFTYEDPNRKGVERLQVHNYQLVHFFEDGFPALTTKKLHWKSVVGELLWFLKGDTNIKYLNDNGIRIWDLDSLAFSKDGSVGRIYGAQWRDWKRVNPEFNFGFDQIQSLIDNLRKTPMGTKHIVTAWNPDELDNMALPPCHWSFEILPKPIPNELRVFDERLRIGDTVSEEQMDKIGIPKYSFVLKWHQRSVDTFLGLPFNIASYALLAHIIGKLTNMVPEAIIGDLSNVHIYENHSEAVKTQLHRDPKLYGPCKLEFSHSAELIGKGYSNISIDTFLDKHDIGDFNLENYESYPSIKAEMLPYNK